jgi:hypothetical protein
MGEFIKTGFVVPGHDIDFTYPDGQCELRCECGWTTEITSYPNPWVIIEVNSRMRRHLAEFGINTDEEPTDD